MGERQVCPEHGPYADGRCPTCADLERLRRDQEEGDSRRSES